MRWYRRVLGRLWPPLDREFGAAIEDTLAARLADARQRGALSYVFVLMREAAGLVRLAAFALAARMRYQHRTRARRRQMAHVKAGPMEGTGHELRLAVRRLLRAPAFTTAAVLTLALAIGANATIFALVERVVLRPLPYPQSDSLITLDHGALALNIPAGMGNTSGMYFLYASRAQSIASAALFAVGDETMTGLGDAERVRVCSATPSLATVLRVRPAIGRWFTEDEGRPRAPRVAVLSQGFWTRRFGRDPAAIGRALLLSGQAVEIVGVMPQGFAFPDPAVDFWTVEQVSPETGFGLFDYDGVARLRDGVSYEAARAELQTLVGTVAAVYPDDPRAAANAEAQLVFSGRPLKDATLGGVARALWILLASVAVVLLVACANVANLFLVRSDARQREVAIRGALGAGRAGLVRFFLSESVLLSLAGGALGLLLTWGALRLLVQAGPATLPRLHEVRVDGVVFAYAAALSALAAVMFAAIPMLRGTAASALHDQGRANTASRYRHRTRHLLLAGQVALALVLLVASGLMVRSFQNLRAVDPGFNPSSALTFTLGLSDRKYPDLDAAVAAHRAIGERLTALPGVEAVGATTCLPLSGGCSGNTVLVDGVVYPDGSVPPLALFRAVSGNYFETMGMRLLRGRTITRDDVDRREPVAVLSEAFAASAFGDADPIGRRVASNQPPPAPGMPAPLVWLTVVGIVADTPMRAVNEPTRVPQLFMPLSFARGSDVPLHEQIGPAASTVSYVVRTVTPPLDLFPAVRASIREFDPDLPIAQVSSLQQLLDRASAQMAFTMVLLAVAAAVALLLGLVGIYGVMSYVVSQRTGEIGVRIALGAAPANVAAQILRQGAVVALAGIAVGTVFALAGGQVMAGLLFGISHRDPGVLAAMASALFVVALIACWLPARRAARMSPISALREL